MKLRIAAVVVTLLIVEAAVASGPNTHNFLDCQFCHDDTPRFGVDTRETVGFYRFEGDDPALCYVCHKEEENVHPVDVKLESEVLSAKEPLNLPLGTSFDMKGKVVCTTCHFIHAPDTRYSLLRGFPGSQKPKQFSRWQDFCRHCHGEKLEQRSPHSGDDRACAYCHAARPTEGEMVTLLLRGVALCNFCHGVDQEDHTRNLLAFEGPTDCLTCHDPHLGEKHPARLKTDYFDLLRGTVTIDPHGRRVLCSLCHVEEKKFTLLNKDTNLLCNRCHASRKIVGSSHPLSKIPSLMKIPEGWPVRKGELTCLTCHLVGHPEDKDPTLLLRGGPYESRKEFCRRCHEPPVGGHLNPHAMIRGLKGCDHCHSEVPIFGKDTARTVTFKANINVLCLRCHDDLPHPGGVAHPRSVDAERAAQLPGYYPLAPFNRITCATCHNPHLPETQNFMLRETLNNMEICTICHRV